MKSWISYCPSLVPVLIVTAATDYADACFGLSLRKRTRVVPESEAVNSACFPACVAAAAHRDQPRQDRKGYLRRRPAAEVEPDRALDPRDHLPGHPLGAKRLEVMAGVAPAPDQADEAGVGKRTRLERLDQVGRVVVGVHDV